RLATRVFVTATTRDYHQGLGDASVAFHDLSTGLFTFIIRILPPARHHPVRTPSISRTSVDPFSESSCSSTTLSNGGHATFRYCDVSIKHHGLRPLRLLRAVFDRANREGTTNAPGLAGSVRLAVAAWLEVSLSLRSVRHPCRWLPSTLWRWRQLDHCEVSDAECTTALVLKKVGKRSMAAADSGSPASCCD